MGARAQDVALTVVDAVIRLGAAGGTAEQRGWRLGSGRHSDATGALPGSVQLACWLVAVTLREITEANLDSVLEVRTTPEQERFVSTVADSIAEAAANPQGNPWYRAVYADDHPVGFVMLSWDVEPQPPHINGPWFLWKLLIDSRHQQQGHGREVLRQVVELVRAERSNRAAHQLRAWRGWPGRLLRATRVRPAGGPRSRRRSHPAPVPAGVMPCLRRRRPMPVAHWLAFC